MTKGVPEGAQMAWLSSRSSGTPLERSFVAELTNWALTHGPLAAVGGGNAQPATT
jgi:hypothetical protein